MHFWTTRLQFEYSFVSISGLVVEYIVAIDVTRVRFPADTSVRVFFLSLGDGRGRPGGSGLPELSGWAAWEDLGRL